LGARKSEIAEVEVILILNTPVVPACCIHSVSARVFLPCSVVSLTEKLTGKNVFEMIYFVSSGMYLTQSQSLFPVLAHSASGVIFLFVYFHFDDVIS